MQPTGYTQTRTDHRLSARAAAVKWLRVLRLNRIAARLYYRHVHGFASAGRELPEVIRRCLRRAVDTGTAQRGDYYEFGVFKGHTFLRAQLAARELEIHGLRFFGFDSFQGLPPVGGVDATPAQPFYEGQYAWPLNRVRAELTTRGVDWERTFLIEGYFKDTLNETTRAAYRMTKASVVLLDSDLYESAACALEFLQDMLVDEGILIMDDWNAFDGDEARGERRAMAEFLQAHPEWTAEPWFRYGSYGQVFVMHHTRTGNTQDAQPTRLIGRRQRTV
jgi:O-methyltransferase